jgi:putative drug exporter of the RND superfamily
MTTAKSRGPALRARELRRRTTSFLQLFGIGAGFAVIVDATLIRAVLVPAFQRILGRAAWYVPVPLRG